MNEMRKMDTRVLDSGQDVVEVTCPACGELTTSVSSNSEIHCKNCKCIVLQMPICTRRQNHSERKS